MTILVRSASRFILACEVVDGELVIEITNIIGLLPIINGPGEGIIIRAEGSEVIIERKEQT